MAKAEEHSSLCMFKSGDMDSMNMSTCISSQKLLWDERTLLVIHDRLTLMGLLGSHIGFICSESDIRL